MAPSSPSTTAATTTSEANKKPLHVVFIHLDLGIGGAEQLVLQLATASQDLGHKVDIVTTRCDQDHCFSAVKKSPLEGRLANNVHLFGQWIPTNLFGIATAFCSTIRMLYLTLQVCRCRNNLTSANTDTVVVLDVLPTSIPLLRRWLPSCGVLFYCHFPDKLLLQRQGGIAKQGYRKLLDALEESTMRQADTLVVNSNFTLSQVHDVFPSLLHKDIKVLYPALDTSKMIQANNEAKTATSPIVSLNRFERKKNIGLLLETFALLKKTYQQSIKVGAGASSNSISLPLPPVIIAGGYDTKNVENVQYRGELQVLCEQLNLLQEVTFLLDISDDTRAELFQMALCVVYTPDREHFGIVPLEAMYAGTPVVAVHSGGPTETVRDGVTGFLRESTPEAFGQALQEFIQTPTLATQMGKAGRDHVEDKFGTRRFRDEWKVLVKETLSRRKVTSIDSNCNNSNNSNKYSLWRNSGMYFSEALAALGVCLLITWVLRQMGLIGPVQSIWGAFRKSVLGDEL
jgi:alpha-1,3/alpha-1,6-mannosyltransferase